MKKFKHYLPSIIFNLVELATILGIGFFFKLSFTYIACIFVSFVMNKVIWGKSMHYKDWYICFSWSALLFISFYLLAQISIELACLATCTFYVLSENANIIELANLFMWNNSQNKVSKYADIEEYVKFNEYNPKLVKFEEKLKEQDTKLFLIYKYRFKDKMTFRQISEKTYLETNRITEELDKIALSIRLLKDI